MKTYTLNSSAIAAAHTGSWTYESGEKLITATDGSVWTAYNSYANKNQSTIQIKPGKGAYVLTPSVDTKITKISVVTNTKSDGSGDVGTRPVDILSLEGETILDDVTGETLAAGIDVKGDYKQLKIIADETAGGSTYITTITITTSL